MERRLAKSLEIKECGDIHLLKNGENKGHILQCVAYSFQ
jgi:hypothetical protein